MDAGTWAKLKDWFGDALDAPPDRVRDIVDAAYRESPTLANELRALLDAHQEPSLKTAGAIAAAAAVEAYPDGPGGGTVGPYRLVRELGRGGTGLVFLAERTDDEFHRPVALKVLRYVAWDRRTRDFLTVERRVLSQMQHPNIAALLDWGVTAQGMPWMATEYVEGLPIDEYCRSHHLEIDSILKIFEQVCRAVQYAHQRLVVHRDLKPANILVADTGLVKLLDFGISKLLEDDAATRTLERRFTPAYASPEQINGESITAAADVYSLGLILYELLTGAVPHAGGSMRDVFRRLEDTELPPPSSASGLTARRRRALRGDLDRIVVHALARDPERRYPSVEQLLTDLDRYRSGYPIAALRPSVVHRVRKFVRRHVLPVTASVLAIAALIAGTAVAVWNARVAREEQRISERRFRDLQELARTVIFDLHDSIRLIPGSSDARRLLATTAVRYLDRLDADNVDDDSLQRDLASGYVRMGYVLGGLTGVNLGNTQDSRRSYRNALRILDGLWLRHPHDDLVGALRFAAAYNLSMMIDDPAEGAALAKKYAAEAEEWVRRDGSAPALQASELVHAGLARTLRAQGAFHEALASLDVTARHLTTKLPMTAAFARPRKMFETWFDRGQNYFDLGLALFARTEVLLEMGRLDEAIRTIEESRQHIDRAATEGLGGASNLRLAARVHGLEAQTLLELGRLDEAAAAASIEMAQAQANTSDGNATGQRDLAEAFRHRGNIQMAKGRLDAGLDDLRQAVAIIDETARLDTHFLMNRFLLTGMLIDQGEGLLRGRQPEAAETAFVRAVELSTAGVAAAPSWLEFRRERARALSGLGRVAQDRGATHPAAREYFKQSAADWTAVRERSPLTRRYLPHQRLVERELANRVEPPQ